MTKWEYSFMVLDLEAADDSIEMSERSLNEGGQEGWEVVTILPRMGAGRSWCYALLKRPVVS